MPKTRLSLLGFGNVGKAFARLLLQKKARLLSEFGCDCLVTGISTASHGTAINSDGLDLEQVLETLANTGSVSTLDRSGFVGDTLAFIRSCPADVLIETSPLNTVSGQPAISYIEEGLRLGMHVITANKGPVVHGYARLSALAREHGRHFLFEATVMDGAPIFSLFRGPLAGAKLLGFSGVLNSCTNLILESMEAGEALEQAIANAIAIGITETDPSNDVDGWDAAVKVAALATVLMDHPLTPQQVQPTGIRGISLAMIAAAKAAGQRWKLVCSAQWVDGHLDARVHPQLVGPDSPLYNLYGTSSFIEFKLDVLPGLGILESMPGPDTTALGLLSDLIYALGKSR